MHLFSFNTRLNTLRPTMTARVIALALTFGIANPLLHGQVFTEIGDAGQTPGTAQSTGLSQTLSGGQITIFGTISGANDADVFRINVTAPTLFSASTNNALTRASGGPLGLDTQLFLFDSSFRPVMMNDDASGLIVQSTLPAGSPFMFALSAGVYYIAISLAGNDPVNINNQLVFAMNGGDTTRVRGANSGISPNTWSDFDNGAFFAQQGAYQINIFNVPENGSTLIFIALALLGLAFMRNRLATSAVRRSVSIK